MIKPVDIMTAINKKIVETFPYAVYIQRCPKDFVRPSFWIEYVTTSRRDVNRSTVAKTVFFTITCFAPLDKHNRVNPEELMKFQEDVIQLFADGFLTVGDRAIKVQSSTGGIDDDRAYIDLQFEFFDNRSDAVDDTPLIRSVEIKLEEG